KIIPSGGFSRVVGSAPDGTKDRLTRVQLLFTRNLSPLQSSKFSFEYLLLPPRSALEAVRPGFIRQVSCYTLLSGFRLPWPPSCCLDELTPFVVSDERAFRHLNLAFGSSRIASSAYQKWPTSDGPFECPRKLRQEPATRWFD
ncbi:hypothetical protein M433DRAFT_78559, partial [Acidomyces richmondensis BFW]